MSCGCSAGLEPSDQGDGDPCEFAEVTRVGKTRKAHRCCECSATIPAGSRCCAFSGKGDGELFRMYRCLDCAFLVEMIALEDKVCVVWCGLADYWNEFRHHGGGRPLFHDVVASRELARTAQTGASG